MRSAWIAIGVVLAGLLAAAALGAGGEPSARRAPAPGGERAAPVRVIARRVERLRGLRFRALPVPVRVSAGQARREGLADLDRSYPPAQRHADEEVLKLLRLIEPRDDLRAIFGTVYGEGVAGYYDPRSKRLRIVAGAGSSTRVITEMTLAHELTHALEDQRYGLADATEGGGSDDAGLARLALVEGSATVVMQRYVERFFGAGEALGGLLGAAFQPQPDLPPFVEDQLLFPYVGGARFVGALLDRAGGRWTLADLADHGHPPVSTEQVLHPARYLRFAAPLRVGLADVRRRLGPGWRRLTGGTWGELQTRELLASAGGTDAAAAAAGWGGDRYALWRAGSAPPGCAAPCRSADVLAMRWRWDTRRDAAQFRRALGRLLEARFLAVSDRVHSVAVVGDPRTALLLLGPRRVLRRFTG